MTYTIGLALLPLSTVVACSDPDPQPPASAPLGVDPAVRAGVGEARAGIIGEGAEAEAALFGGVTAEGRAGDVKLYNHLVQVVIQGPYEGNGYIDAGGGIIDLDLVREEGALGRDLVEDLFLAFDLSRLAHATSIEILADGSDGGSAIVQTRGTDVPWKFMMGLLELDEPRIGELELDIVTTYELAPDAYTLSVVTTLTNSGDEVAAFLPQDGSFVSGEDLLSWAPGLGFEGPPVGPIDAAVFTGRQGEATFSTWAEGGMSISALAALTADLGIFLAEFPYVELSPGESTTLSRTLAITPDTATAEALRRASVGEALATVGGVVRTNGVGVPGVRVHLVDDLDQVAGFAMTGEDGAWSAEVPLGEWTAWAVASGDNEILPLPAGAGRYGPFAADSVNQRQLDVLAGLAQAPPLPYAVGRATPPPTSFSLTASGATVDIELAAPGSLRIEVVDGSGAPLPGVVDLSWAAGGPPASVIPETLLGPLGISSGGRAAWAWTATGTLEIDALPGAYTVSAGHSWRYDRATTEVEVVEGEVSTVHLVLDEVVPRDGWLALDPHLHAAPSFDGALPMEDRLVTCAATGVDLPVTTDHDAIADYRSLATALGLDARLRVLPGTEVTTLARGHFNLYPLDPAPLASPNGGAVPWWNPFADTQELFDRMRQVAGPDAVIQANHPRTPGMFTVGDFEPETASPSTPDYWSWDFQTFELLNGGVDDLEQVRDDWFAMLDFGQVRVPTGASDSHYRYMPCGQSRTDVYLDTTDIGAVSSDAVRNALLAGHVVVASGTTLRATVTGTGEPALPGDLVVGDSLTIHATVRAPEWIQPGTLRVYVGGVATVEEELPAAAADGVWLDKTWTVAVAADTWIVVEVAGTQSQGSAWRDALPYAATNAFFVDTSGDGWASPRSLFRAHAG